MLFWLSWLALFYLAWPRLVGIGRQLLRHRSRGKPVKLEIPPLRPKWDLTLEKGLEWATRLFLGLSILELLFRRPQLERFSLPIFGLCLALTLLVRGLRYYFRSGIDRSEIVFPHVATDTAIGTGLCRAQDALVQLRGLAVELDRKGGAFSELASGLLAFVEEVRLFLLEVRLEPFESVILRQAQPLLIRMETLIASFELLARVSDESELRKVSEGLAAVLGDARSGFEDLRVAQGEKLLNRVDVLVSVLRNLYQAAP